MSYILYYKNCIFKNLTISCNDFDESDLNTYSFFIDDSTT